MLECISRRLRKKYISYFFKQLITGICVLDPDWRHCRFQSVTGIIFRVRIFSCLNFGKVLTYLPTTLSCREGEEMTWYFCYLAQIPWLGIRYGAVLLILIFLQTIKHIWD